MPEKFQSPKPKRILNKEVLKVIQFLDNDPTTTLPSGVGTIEKRPSTIVDNPVSPTKTLPKTKHTSPTGPISQTTTLPKGVGTIEELLSYNNSKEQQDAKGVSNFHLDGNGRVVRTDSDHPRCNYCFTASHPRVSCKFRQLDLDNNVDRAVHPLKGLLKDWQSNPDVGTTEKLLSYNNSKEQQDAKGVSNFHLDGNGRVVRTDSDHPRCNYCFTASHPRTSCKFRQHDLENNVDRTVHQLKGLLKDWPSNPDSGTIGKSLSCKNSNIARQHPTDLPALWDTGSKWPTTQSNTPASITITITDPEDTKWLAQATSSGLDPASLVTTLRHTTQPDKPTPSDQRPDTPNTSSIVKPTAIGIRRPANTTTTWLDEFGTNRKVPYTFY